MASIYKCDGKTIRPGQQFTDANGTVHPGSWYTYSAEQKTAIGITEIVQQPHPNSVLYNWGYNDDGTVTSTAKPLDDVNEVDENGDPLLDDDGVQVVTKGVKSNLIAEVRTQQGALLSQTDWAYVRKMDTTTAVPANIQTWRDEIRLVAAAMEDQITQAATTDAIAALFVTYTVEDDDSITKSGILYDWPVLLDN